MKNELIIGFTSNLSSDLADAEKFSRCDAVVVIAPSQTTFSVKDELKSCALSSSLKKLSSVCPLMFFLTDTDDFGVKRRSALCFENGSLTKIADCNKTLPPYSPGFGYENFSLRLGERKVKIGLAVDKDVTDCSCLSVLSSQDDAIIGLSANFSDFNALSFTTSAAYLFRTPFCLIGKNYAYASKSSGECVFKSVFPQGVFTLPLSSSYFVYTKKYRT